MDKKIFLRELCDTKEARRKLKSCRAQRTMMEKYSDLNDPEKRQRYDDLGEEERTLMFVCGEEAAEQGAAPDAAVLLGQVMEFCQQCGAPIGTRDE